MIFIDTVDAYEKEIIAYINQTIKSTQSNQQKDPYMQDLEYIAANLSTIQLVLNKMNNTLSGTAPSITANSEMHKSGNLSKQPGGKAKTRKHKQGKSKTRKNKRSTRRRRKTSRRH